MAPLGEPEWAQYDLRLEAGDTRERVASEASE